MPDGQHYDDQQQYSGDEATNVKRANNHMPEEDRIHASQSQLQAQYAQQQAAQLRGHVQIDDHAVVDPPFWAGMDQHALYNAATRRNDPGTVDALGQQFTQNGNELATAANELNEALTALDANWEGRAASTARGSIQPLADHAGQMGMSAQLMGTSLSQQSVAASDVQRLPPPQEFDAAKALQHNKEVDANGGQPIDINAETSKANANKAEQVRFLTEYTNAMSAADKQMPVFVKPPETIKSGGGGGTSSVSGGQVVSRKTGDVHNPYQGTAPTPTSARPASGATNDPNDPNNDLPAFGTPIAGTSASGYAGPSAPVTTGPGLGSGPMGGTPHASGPSAGSGGFGGSFGNFNGGTAGGPEGAPARGGAAAEGGRTGGRGMGGGMPAEEAFGRGGRAGGTGSSAGRGGIGGGHGAKGEEDEEHERPSYLLEPDPDAVFDTDQMTAPPVIGGE